MPISVGTSCTALYYSLRAAVREAILRTARDLARQLQVGGIQLPSPFAAHWQGEASSSRASFSLRRFMSLWSWSARFNFLGDNALGEPARAAMVSESMVEVGYVCRFNIDFGWFAACLGGRLSGSHNSNRVEPCCRQKEPLF